MKLKNLIASALCGFAVSATAETVSYWDPVDKVTKSADATVVTSGTATLEGGWYFVEGEVSRAQIDVTGTDANPANLILADGAKLTASGNGDNKPGIKVSSGVTLNIYAQSVDADKMGQLSASGGNYAAGIGGAGEGGTCGTVNIYGGHVAAKGGEYAAGIGGGGHNDVKGGTGGNISIYGGIVTANGENGGAAIGGGNRADGGNISIYGGEVIADNLNGDGEGAGIGGGYAGAAGTVLIAGGIVTARGGDKDGGGAGIGGGEDSNGEDGSVGTVTITGGVVTATGGDDGCAGIGGGDDGNGCNVTISGGQLKVNPGKNAPAIGAGDGGKSQGTVVASGGIFSWRPNDAWLADPTRMAVLPNPDAATSGTYPWMVLEYMTVTFGWPLAHMTAAWTSGDGSVTNAIGGMSFAVPKGATDVKIVFTPEDCYELDITEYVFTEPIVDDFTIPSGDLPTAELVPYWDPDAGITPEFLVEDHAIDGGIRPPGLVLQHNHRYVVSENTTVLALTYPGLSALRVPFGCAAVIDIADGVTLKVVGGPGYGRVPGGAGIEVPLGAKLVVRGGTKSKLVAVGGNAARGGTGYGGMVGQFGYLNLYDAGNTAAMPFEYPAGAVIIDENNGVRSDDFLAAGPLKYGKTGYGGTGGAGGGGAGAGIGGRGGFGGAGGAGGPDAIFTSDDCYDDRRADYNAMARFFDYPCVMTYDAEKPTKSGVVSHYCGAAASNGGHGSSGAACGEVVFVGRLTVDAQQGGSGEGGENGSYGDTTMGYEESSVNSYVDGNYAAGYIGLAVPVCNVVNKGLVAGGAKGKALIPAGIGFACNMVVSLVKLFVASDKSMLSKQRWFVGGGGGGGGGGGEGAFFGIGAGGPGGGGGGGGSSGLFAIGIGSVYKMKGLFKLDVNGAMGAVPLSGRGGEGGRSLQPGNSGDGCTRETGGTGEANHVAKEEGSSEHYNFNTTLSSICAWTWPERERDELAEFSAAEGGVGGNPGLIFTNDTPVLMSANVNTGDTTFRSRVEIGNRLSYALTFVDGDTPVMAAETLCGQLVEDAPAMRADKHEGLEFDGFYTEPDGRGAKVFDRYGHPLAGARLTGDTRVYAHWVAEGTHASRRLDKIVTVKDGDWGAGHVITESAIYNISENMLLTDGENMPGIRIADGVTAALYIPKDVTLVAKGADATADHPGYAGIEVPETSSLIVFGDGALIASGGHASDGAKGGKANESTTELVNRHYEHFMGAGGAGGAGGSGAGAGIGGNGGAGGAGGSGAAASAHERDGDVSGVAGSAGADGTAGTGMGEVCLLGRLTVLATPGTNGVGGAVGDLLGENDYGDWEEEIATLLYPSYWMFGHGGPGGGGGGGTAYYGIGGGGGGGAGGGGGGTGADIHASYGRADYYDLRRDCAVLPTNGESGHGGMGGLLNGGAGGDRARTSLAVTTERGATVGAGGSGGTAGRRGGDGILSCSADVLLNANGVVPSRPDMKFAAGHEALERTMTFYFAPTNAVDEPAYLGEVAAQIWSKLPTLPTNVTRAVKGYVIEYAYEVKDGVTNDWYGVDATPLKDRYDSSGDVTLYITLVPDVWHMAPVPDSLDCTYTGENFIGFRADECPGCTYVSGTTNAVNAGYYDYTVRLGEGYTIWSDLSTESERRIPWMVGRAVLTNQLPSVSMTYDWTRSSAENLARFNAGMFDPPLPEGASVEFKPGKIQQVNVRTVEAHLTGGPNYADNTLYLAFSSAQPVSLALQSHYPWDGKVTISYRAADFAGHEADKIAFLENYGASNVVAQALLVDTNGTVLASVVLDESVTVAAVASAGTAGLSVEADLSDYPELSGRRIAALPISVSIGWQIFEGGSVAADLTAAPVKVEETMADGTVKTNSWPVYTMTNTSDIFPINCSVAFVDSTNDQRLAEMSEVLLAIGGADGSHGTPAVPKAVDGSSIVKSGTVRWTPAGEGVYMLEHYVNNQATISMPLTGGGWYEREPGLIGYRRAYFDFGGQGVQPGGEGGEEPVVEKWLIGKDYPSAVMAYVDAGGTLHIEGAGNVKTFESVDDVPWKDETIRKITMDSAVTGIGAGQTFLGLGDPVLYRGITLGEHSEIAQARGEGSSADGAISTDFSGIEVVNGKAILGVTVSTNGDLTASTANWNEAKVESAKVEEDGTVTLTVPAPGDKGFMILKSKGITK